jgi:hypothetical protein
MHLEEEKGVEGVGANPRFYSRYVGEGGEGRG